MLFGEILLLVIGILLLIKGSDFFVDAGSEIGNTLKINELLLGVTIVSFGTSLPEFIVALTSAQSGSTEIALGNILGTNLFNTCVILAIIAIVKPIRFTKETVRKDMYMSVLTSFILMILMADKIIDGDSINILSRTDGLVLVALFAVFIYYTLYSLTDLWKERKNKNEELKLKLKDIDSLTKNILLMILGIVMVFAGANASVDAVEKIAVILGISETFIAILVVAIGTSLPEIFTSIAALKKGKQDIAVGNLIGSNMFNILFVLGTAVTISPIKLKMDSLVIDAFTFFLVTIIFVLHAKGGKKYEMGKGEGFCLLAIYVVYTLYVIIRG
jgi:cation:H+ antiporter